MKREKESIAPYFTWGDLMTNPEDQKPSSHDDSTRLRYILDIIMEGVWEWDANTAQVKRSPGWYRMLNYDQNMFPENVLTWEKVIHPDDFETVMQHFEAYTSGQSSVYDIEYRCIKGDGDFLWIRDQGRVVERSKEGVATFMIGAHLDIHQLKLAQTTLQIQNGLLNEEKLTFEQEVAKRTAELIQVNLTLETNLKKIKRLKDTDYLTSVYNRHKSETELLNEIARSKRYHSPLSVALFDVDEFKIINDTYGHQNGDLVLQKVSDLVIKHIRGTDILGRWGGDEFIIILPGVGLLEAVTSIEKIRSLIAGKVFSEDLRVTCSFGVTEYAAGDTVSTIYKRTDIALYKAKHAGRNVVVHY
jgi:diguanylate cyclase (GGDEF)-like protein/PAS domain S-box-containing protein